MNILIIGKPLQNLYDALRESKRLEKLYTATINPLSDVPNIEFDTFEELASKAKALKIDIAITTDKALIEAGITDVLRKNFINIFAVNRKWYNLEDSRLIAKQLANYYSINTPQVIKVPLTFPVILKTDKPECTYIADNMDNLTEKMESLSGKKMFLEEHLQGEVFELTSLWDRKNLMSYPIDNLNEVQIDRLELYKTKLHIMLSDENANFVGFITSKLIWAKNDWYLLDFKMRLDENSQLKGDIVYILNSALYQKLNEISV